MGTAHPSVAALAVCALLTGAVLAALAYHRFVASTIAYVTDQICTASGWNPWAVKGFLVVVTIPFFIAVTKSARVLLVLLLYGWASPYLALYRNRWGIIVVVYIGAFYLTMYAATRSEFYRKVCVVTPEGLRAYDGLARDPVYGLLTAPCTADQIIELRRAELDHRDAAMGALQNLDGPRAIQIVDAATFPFFDAKTGMSLVWYAKEADGSFRFFNGPGRDPVTDAVLAPVDRQLRDQLLALQQHSEAKAQSEAVARYVDSSLHPDPGAEEAAVLIISAGEERFPAAEAALRDALQERRISASPEYFRPAFIGEGKADQLLNGDWGALSSLHMEKNIRLAIVGRMATTFSSSPDLDGIISANIVLDLSCINVATERSCGRNQIHSAGAGFSRESALAASVKRAQLDLDSFVAKLNLE